LFVCHASEDKESIVRPLVAALRAKGLSVWYDEFELTLGDSLRRKIDEGLAKSRFGLVILSHAFFAKKWPQDELDGLAARERDGEKVILPLWHRIDHDAVARYSPMLASRFAGKTDEGIESLVDRILKAIHAVQTAPTRGGVDAGPGVAARQRGGAWASVATLLSPEARRIADWLFDHDAMGLPGTPSHLVFTIASELGMEEQDCEDACRELKKFGLADIDENATMYVSANHHTVMVVTRDLGYDPGDDDRALAAELAKTGRAMDGEELATALHLPPDRINRAAWRLRQRGKIDLYATNGTAPYAFHDLKANFETRQAVKSGELS
jgi:TIR domain